MRVADRLTQREASWHELDASSIGSPRRTSAGRRRGRAPAGPALPRRLHRPDARRVARPAPRDGGLPSRPGRPGPQRALPGTGIPVPRPGPAALRRRPPQAPLGPGPAALGAVFFVLVPALRPARGRPAGLRATGRRRGVPRADRPHVRAADRRPAGRGRGQGRHRHGRLLHPAQHHDRPPVLRLGDRPRPGQPVPAL